MRPLQPLPISVSPWVVAVLALAAACTRAPARDPLLLGWQQPGDSSAPESFPQPPPLLPQVEYAVVMVPAGETLPVREQAGSSGSEVARLQPDQRPVRVTGVTSLLGSSVWVEVELPGGGQGWMRAWNLTEARTADQACSDPRLFSTLDDFLQAGKAGDPLALRRTVSPWRGLAIRLDAGGGEVHLAPESLGDLYPEASRIDWLARPEAGAGASGSFTRDVVEPLAAAVKALPPVCGELPAGESAVTPEWPSEYANLNFVAFHAPADPTGSEFIWNTWVVGFDYAGGVPYVAVILRYQAEI